MNSGNTLSLKLVNCNLIRQTFNLIEGCEYDPFPLSIVGEDVALFKIEKLPSTGAHKRGRDKVFEKDAAMDFKLHGPRNIQSYVFRVQEKSRL